MTPQGALIVSALSAKLHPKLSMCGGQVSSSNGNGMSIRSQLKYPLSETLKCFHVS